MTPDSLLVAAGMLGDVELTESAEALLVDAAYWMLRSGVRYSPAEYSALSSESQRALRSASKRLDEERAESVAEAVMSRLSAMCEAVGAESAQTAAELLLEAAPK
jgi:CRP-like cAMP-binding protein